MTKHYTLTEAQLQTMIGWMRHHPQRCANALENLIPSDDYETVKAALETEREAANLYAKQVAHWMHKHDELLHQQLAAPVPKEWTDENVIAWCVARGIKNTPAPKEQVKLEDASKIALATLCQYASKNNWDKDFHGINRKWLEPDSDTRNQYNGYEFAQQAVQALKLAGVTA